MFTSSRAGVTLLASVIIAGITAAPAHAEPAAAPADKISGSLVQIKTVITGSVFVKFDIENSVEGWSSPLTHTVVCAGVAVEDTRIVTSASCTDPASYTISSEMRKQATKEILMRDGREERIADIASSIGAGQKWKVVADPQHPDSPPKVTITVRGVGGDGGMVQATQEASAYGTRELTGPVSLIRLSSKLDGLTPALFAEEAPLLGSTVFLAGPSSGSFEGPAPTADLRRTDLASMPTDDGKPTIKLGISTRSQDMGGPVVDEDGVVVGVMPYDDSTSGVESTSLRTYLTAKGVTFAEPAAPAKPSSIWLWLGPVIAVVVLLIGVGAFVLLRRRRRRTAGAPGAAGYLFPGQQFPGQPQSAPQFAGQQFPGQPQPGPPFPGQQFPGQPQPTPQFPGQTMPEQTMPGQPPSAHRFAQTPPPTQAPAGQSPHVPPTDGEHLRPPAEQ